MDLDVPDPPEDLVHAVNHNQTACKRWLVDELYATMGGRCRLCYVLGGWYGVLAAMLLGDERFEVERVISFDIDPRCAPVAEWLNRRYRASGRFEAVSADVRTVDYSRLNGAGAPRGGDGTHVPDLVLNTSCEHIEATSQWYDRVPAGMLLACQSTDYYSCPDHVNCLPDLEAFKADVPMRDVRYEGVLARKRYRRFMIIGHK